jgi:galactitol-specific phosphotransferase system IIB component
MLTEAVRLPLAEGVKVTLIVQLPPATTELPQVLLWAKSPALVPVIAKLEILMAPLPLLLRVAVCAALLVPTDWFPKERLVGERPSSGAVPVPERLTACGLPMALSVMLTEAVRLPLAEGVKVTLIVQLPPAATELPQVLLWAKSPALVPVIARLEILMAPLPLLLRVAVCAALLVPTDCFPKERLVGERPSSGAVPVPERLTACGLPMALSVMLTEAVRLPLAEGLKVTLIVQLAPAATELPQLSV